MSKAWAGGSTTAWRKVRAFVLRRDGYLCRLRLEGCTRRASHVHHIYGKEHGDDPSGLIATCPSCNLKVGRPAGDPSPRISTQWTV